MYDTPRMTYIDFYIFRHRGDMFNESVQRGYTSQHDNLVADPLQEDPGKPWLRNIKGIFTPYLGKVS
jgi:hypothetical protein